MNLKMIRLSAAAAAAALLLVAASNSKSDVYGYWATSLDYTYTITGMPDLDQRRTSGYGYPGLPNGGKEYCAVASGMNILAYIAAHGYPTITPGVKDWDGTGPLANYDAMTKKLQKLGALMHTSASNGTGVAGWIQGMRSHLGDPDHRGEFSLHHSEAKPGSPIKMSGLAKVGLQGGLISLGIGWYKLNESTGHYVRKGGHAVTITDIQSPLLFAPAQISMRDPWESSGGFTTQSLFASNTSTLSNSIGSFGWTEDNSAHTFHSSGPLHLIDTYNGYIDGACIVRPVFLVSTDEAGASLLSPVALTGTDSELLQRFSTGDGTPITSMALDPMDTAHTYITRATNGVWELETLTGVSRRIATIENPKMVAIGGRSRSRYVLSDNQLTLIPNEGEAYRWIPLSYPIDAIVADTSQNRLVGINYHRAGRSKKARDVTYFDADTLVMTAAFNLPFDLDETTPADFAIDPVDATLYMHNEGSSVVQVLRSTRQKAGVPVPLTGVDHPIGLTIDGEGRFMLNNRGSVVVLERDGSPSRSIFNGLPVGRSLQVLQPYTNFENAMRAEAFFNVPPPSPRAP